MPTILDLNQTSKPDADLKYIMTGLSPGGVDWDMFHDKGYFQHIEIRMKDGSSIPKGAIVNMFLVNEGGGYLLESMAGVGDRAGKEGMIDIQDSNGDIHRFTVIALRGKGLNTKIVSLEPLVPAPDYNELLADIRAREARYSIANGQNVLAGQPILQLSGDADRINLHLLTSLKGKKGEASWPQGLTPFLLTNLAMFDSDGKLPVSEVSSNNQTISEKTE